MTTRHRKTSRDQNPPPNDVSEFAENMAKVAEQCQRIMQEFLKKQPQDASDRPLDPFNIAGPFTELFGRMMSDPVGLWEKQLEFYQDYLNLLHSATQKALGEKAASVIEPDPRDKRFKDEAWRQNAVFDFLKQSYLLTARWIQHSVHEAAGDLDPHTARKIDFHTRQFVDAISPSNFLITNPEVLKATIESKGENLVRGLKHMLEDIERGKGKLRISMTDLTAFQVGKNLATTPGEVIFQNELMQLIQYAPATSEVYKTPLLIIPPWINKYYILDLQPENSLVKYLVDQGYTVFVISWVNPGEELSGKTFDDYMLEGPLAAMDAIEKATGEKDVSIGGYCLGGTLLSITLAWLAVKKQSYRVKSATYLTTLVDFTDAGDLSVFIDEAQLQMLESRMSETGYLEGADMATTFNMLRANELIWSFVVNNYLLGKDPFPFDLLYWNADATRMPAAMHSYYLRNMYQKNLLAKPGALTIGGVPIDLKKINTPCYILSSREDHIAPWKSTYAASQIYGNDIRFVLAASGHIAGVVNPPSKNKYCYWTGSNLVPDPDKWLAMATERPGSWWPDWIKWHAQFAGQKVPARKPGSGKLKPIEHAPGSYVKKMV